MVTQKSLPGLGWFFASLRHQARDRALRDFKAEFKKVIVNSRRAPRDVRVGHGPDQRAVVRTYWRSSWCFRLRESPPIPFESFALPRNHRFRPDDYECRFPVLPDRPQPNPKQSVSAMQSWSLSIAF